MKENFSVKLVSASFNEHSSTGIIEYGVRLAKALESQKNAPNLYKYAIVKGNLFLRPKSIFKSIHSEKEIKNPDIIHYIDPGFVTTDAIFKRFRLDRSKIIVTVHDLDMFKYVSAGLKLATKYTNPIGILKNSLAFFSTPFIIMIRSVATKFIVKRAKKIICVSEKTRDELIKTLNVEKERCVVIYPIIGKEFKPLKREKKENKIIIGHLSSYLPNKNVGMLINAFKKTKSKNLELRLYGGPLPFKISDDPRIKYYGFIPTEDIPKVMNSFDVFVFPSTWEGFGMPPMEAKRCKIPVITYEQGQLAEAVKRNTLQFKNEEDLAKILETRAWSKIDVEKAYLDGNECKEDFVAQKTISLYKEILGK